MRKKELRTRSNKHNMQIMGVLEGEKGTNGENKTSQQITVENYT